MGQIRVVVSAALVFARLANNCGEVFSPYLEKTVVPLLMIGRAFSDAQLRAALWCKLFLRWVV